ncbi:hypothetical protein Q7P35_009688 [Cladosporium inversicolor]
MHYLLLPGELRNAIYNALLLTTSPDALRLSKAGVLVAPSLAHTNNLIRRELTSLLEAQSAAVLEAQVFDFDTAPLHAFLLANPSKQQTTTIKLTLHLTSPGAEKLHYAALRAFLLESHAMGWSVGYRVKFDWSCYSLGEAAACAREFASAFMPGSAGEGAFEGAEEGAGGGG